MRRIADLLGHPAEVGIQCGCTRVITVLPGWLLEKLGPDATIEDGERRLVCRTCKERPRLSPKGTYAVTGGRDRRVDPPPMPGWVILS